MNFYCCQIFFLDRFYFIPYRWGGSPEAWRNSETGEVVALWHAGTKVRKDGQIDGVNGVKDPEAFTTEFMETADAVWSNRVLPEGLISSEIVMLDKKMTLVELSKRVGITNVNLSKLKTGKVSAIRFSTLDAICRVLDCQPGDILEYQPGEQPEE